MNNVYSLLTKMARTFLLIATSLRSLRSFRSLRSLRSPQNHKITKSQNHKITKSQNHRGGGSVISVINATRKLRRTDERTKRQIRTRFPNAVRSLVYLSARLLVCLSVCLSLLSLLSLLWQSHSMLWVRRFPRFAKFRRCYPCTAHYCRRGRIS